MTFNKQLIVFNDTVVSRFFCLFVFVCEDFSQAVDTLYMVYMQLRNPDCPFPI